MRIVNYFNTSPEQVESKEYNIWLGLSLGNKYFTPEHIADYVHWSVVNTRDSVLAFIPDEIHAINYEILDGKSRGAAMRKALKQGDQREVEIVDIVSKLPIKQQKKVNIARWSTMQKTENFLKNSNVIFEEFNKRGRFYTHIVNMVKDARRDRVAKLSKENIDKLCEYVLHEIPFFINGVECQDSNGNQILYTLIPYPGFSALDRLFIDLQRKAVFPDLANRLIMENKIQLLEAYVD